MENYENSTVKCILSDLNRIITHAENAIPSVQKGNNEQLVITHFELLTRESESKLNELRREIQSLTEIEIMEAAKDNIGNIIQRFQKMDVDVLQGYNEQIEIASKKLDEKEKCLKIVKEQKEFFSMMDFIQDPVPKPKPNNSIWFDFVDLGLTLYNDWKGNSLEGSVRKEKEKINQIVKSKEQFEQTTIAFRATLRGLNGIQQMLAEKIGKANEIKNNKEKGRGRNNEIWWGAKWEGLSKQEVELRMKRAYDDTSLILKVIKPEKKIQGERIMNSVWAAIYFYAAEHNNLVNPGKSANCVGFIGDKDKPRGLYNIGVFCNKGTVKNYYLVIKAFLNATINNESNIPFINQLLIKVSKEKNTEEYTSTRKWLNEGKNLIHLNNEIDDKAKISDDIVIFVVKNLQLLRKIFFKVHPSFQLAS